MDFKSIKSLVRSILTVDKKSRCSDKWLYTKYIENLNIEGLTGIEKQALISLMRKGKLPSYSSVMRARQYIQSAEPSLTEKVTIKKRRELEELYRQEYGRHINGSK